MKERPILFSGSMVRAILDGRKTMTRRVVKLECTGLFRDHDARTMPDPQIDWQRDAMCCDGPFREEMTLWVRETWRITSNHEAPYSGIQVEYRADGGKRYLEFDEYAIGAKWVNEAAPWRPSIFLPRRLSRITLEITGVRAERLQEITEDDAKAEGVECVSMEESPRQAVWTCRQDFAQLWDNLNGPRGFGWYANPWVWVVSFRRINP